MGFGNFRILFLVFLFLCIGNKPLQGQQKVNTAKLIYNQLDTFLEKPSKPKLHQLSNIIASEEKHLLTKEDQLAFVIAQANMGYYYNFFGNVSNAILHYENAWKTFNNNALDNYDIIENCLQPLGNLYLKIGDLQRATITITNYLYQAEQSQNTTKILSAVTNLSIVYNNQSNYQKAIEILKKGEVIAPKNINILTNLATNYLDAKDIKKAEIYALKVTSIDSTQVNVYQILAAIALEQENLPKAQNYFLKSKSKLLEKQHTSVRDLAKLQLAYLDILLYKRAFFEALNHLKEIYTILIPEYTLEKDVPKKETLIADRIVLKALDIQAYIYQQIDKPTIAIEAYEAAFEVNSKLNLAYPLQDTKIIQHSQNRNRTETFIDLLYSLYKTTKHQEYVVKAFQAAENSKAPFVNEALVSKHLLSQYKNDSLVSKINILNNSLAQYDTYILKEKQKGEQANIPQIQKWNSSRSTQAIEHSEVTKQLQKKYPNLLFKQGKISIVSLQKKLRQDGLTLIEYFFGKETIYQFKIDADSIEITDINNTTDFKNTIQGYIRYFDNASMIINNVEDFSNSSFELYNALNIPATKSILIIPDGLLNFIPFETLLTKKSNSLRFQNMPFLLTSTITSYEISASKYLRSVNTNTDSATRTILGVFPVFENTALALPFSLDEQNLLQQKFDGRFLEKEKATYIQFIDEVENHDILHLSTHAEAGGFSRPASIKFRDQDVLVNQLYGLQLEADLVVLSACETGIGTIAKGEGPLSIARGFQYAGVPNVLFSLWKVNDKTTSELMQYFYKNLHLSNSKAHALYQGKLNYLASEKISNTQKSPYYWAAFVYYGSYQTPSVSNYNWILIIGIFLLIILFLFVIRQKTK
ncbi:CHAT domain-containing protein [Aquimarina sp. 2201CG14-23]|uniref:CHAT domain-containing protein n=1 Tax=Aquimarina mycalae TaxID=3040073 RepID=UPI00247800D5|nr:CHAT domain-containing protein [Aquimarina sp. 2201CG14-23]MDH7445461.1 CHAT domain-containing protein [Aquimarina sp. 2201CG14-23]